MRHLILIYSLAVLFFGLAACSAEESESPLPGPVAMTAEAVGYYCNMMVLEHEGPKAQIHLAGLEHPIWFTQVRDAVAFRRSPEETRQVRAVYVHDMEKAESWAHPGDDAWVNAEDASFVIGSSRSGGMGAPEAIPFGRKEAAERFSKEYGGSIVKLPEIPDRYVLGPVENMSNAEFPDHATMAHVGKSRQEQ
jgi:copper chaperone NosL